MAAIAATRALSPTVNRDYDYAYDDYHAAELKLRESLHGILKPDEMSKTMGWLIYASGAHVSQDEYRGPERINASQVIEPERLVALHAQRDQEIAALAAQQALAERGAASAGGHAARIAAEKQPTLTLPADVVLAVGSHMHHVVQNGVPAEGFSETFEALRTEVLKAQAASQAKKA